MYFYNIKIWTINDVKDDIMLFTRQFCCLVCSNTIVIVIPRYSNLIMNVFQMQMSLVSYQLDYIFRIYGKLKEQLTNKCQGQVNAVHLLEQRSETNQLIN